MAALLDGFKPWLGGRLSRYLSRTHPTHSLAAPTDPVRLLACLARYLLPTPPVPVRWRRRMLALGSGDPTRAICSSLIAQAFQAVRAP